jgi:hypothetical protein
LNREAVAGLEIRAPDAVQRAADPGSTNVGPGSAEQRLTLHRVRDTQIAIEV